MPQRLRMLWPPIGVVGLLLVMVAVTTALEYLVPVADPLMTRFGMDDPLRQMAAETFQSARLAYVAVCVGLLGILRVYRYYPFYQSAYETWLSLTPWRLGQPLPLGPVHLVWEDALIVIVLGVVGLGSPFFPLTAEQWLFDARVLAIVFLLAYVIALGAMNINVRWSLVLSLVLLPLTVYPAFHLDVAIVVLLAVYGIQVLAMRRLLRSFPFVDDTWRTPPGKRYLNAAIADNVIGWPWDTIGPREYDRPLTRTGAVIISALSAWYVHALVGAYLYAEDGAPWSLFVQGYVTGSSARDTFDDIAGVAWLVVIATAIWRFAIYYSIAGPPFSLLGRIRTGRLIIPSHDQVYIAPLCILGYGILGPWLLHRAGCPDELLVFGVAFGVAWLACGAGPSLATWRHTARVRFRPTIKAMAATAKTRSGGATRVQIRIADGRVRIIAPPRG